MKAMENLRFEYNVRIGIYHTLVKHTSKLTRREVCARSRAGTNTRLVRFGWTGTGA